MKTSAPTGAVSRVSVWLQLLRAPNLFTVPGDPVAGYLISNAGFIDGSIGLVAAASLCFYGAGLLLNDLVDIAEDRAERPNRPLPALQVSPAAVRRTFLALNVFGLLLLLGTGSSAALIGGAATVISVWSYNCLTKRLPFVGALNMGLCRTLSMLTGALAGPSPYAVPIAAAFAVTTGVYIAAVTNLARFETRSNIALTPRVLPFLALVPGVGFGLQNALYAPDKLASGLLLIFTLFAALLLLRQLLTKPVPALPPLIGAHIRLLLPLQAAACWFGASQGIGPACALILLAVWPLSRLVSKRFYAS